MLCTQEQPVLLLALLLLQKQMPSWTDAGDRSRVLAYLPSRLLIPEETLLF